MMKRVLLVLTFMTIPHFSALAQLPRPSAERDPYPMIKDPPSIPGVTVIASLGKICPREAPLRVDCNGDGTEDLRCPSYHVGQLKEYISSESAGGGRLARYSH